MKIVYYDLETNGLQRAAKILQFAFIGYDSGRDEPLRLVEYVNPEEALDRRAAEVHGITSVQLSSMNSFDFFADDIIELLKDSVLIGFNNHSFDDPKLAKNLGITVDELNESLSGNIDVKTLCNKVSIRGKLEVIAEQHRLQNPMPHNAYGDVGVTIRLLYRLLNDGSVELPVDIGISKEDFMELIEKGVDLEDESYLIIESEPAQMYSSMVENGIVQFGPYAGKTLDELRLIDEYLWNSLVNG